LKHSLIYKNNKGEELEVQNYKLKEQNKQLSSVKDQLEQSLNNTNKKIEELEVQILKLKRENKQLSSSKRSIKNKYKDYKNLQKISKSLNTNNEIIKGKIEKQSNDLIELKKEYSQLNGIITLLIQNQQLDQPNENILSQLNYLLQQIQNHQSSVNEVNCISKKTIYQTVFNLVIIKIPDIITNLTSFLNQFSDLNSNLTNLQSSSTNLQNQINNVFTVIEELKTQIYQVQPQ
jgi:chromosome segregation ATPase